LGSFFGIVLTLDKNSSIPRVWLEVTILVVFKDPRHICKQGGLSAPGRNHVSKETDNVAWGFNRSGTHTLIYFIRNFTQLFKYLQLIIAFSL